MASVSTSSNWLTQQVLIYDDQKEKGKKLVWSGAVWRFVQFGIPVIILWGVLGVYVPVFVAEIKYQARMTSENFQAVFPRGSMMPSWSWEMLPSWVNGFALEIPKLGIQEPVVEGVDASNKTEYLQALTNGVAHSKISSLPGQPGTQYYFAHSSGLPFWGGRAVTFATIYKLENGDEVWVYREGKKYRYQVIDKKIVNPDDLSFIESQGVSEKVVLQTCWPIGTNWKRLLVTTQLVN